MPKIRKNYRLDSEVLEKLEVAKQILSKKFPSVSDTAVLEACIVIAYSELLKEDSEGGSE